MRVLKYVAGVLAGALAATLSAGSASAQSCEQAPVDAFELDFAELELNREEQIAFWFDLADLRARGELA